MSNCCGFQVKEINKHAYRRVYEDVMKTLDRWENEFLPQVSLDITDVSRERSVCLSKRTSNIVKKLTVL